MTASRTSESANFSADQQGVQCDCPPELLPAHNHFRLYTEGDKLYADMLATISTARQSVNMESYIFADDEIGRRFAEALAERSRNGVKVKLHIDAAGSLFRISRKLVNYLRQQGVELRWFHRWRWNQPWRYNRRDHRKLLVVDDRIAYLGGFNIHRENSFSLYGEQRWRDTHIVLQGELAALAARFYEAFWKGNLRWLPDDEGNGSVDSVLVHNHTRNCRNRLRCIYADAFTGAKQTIYLTTPYFVPDHHLQRELKAAARRGVDVRLLVPAKSDTKLTQWAAKSAYKSLLLAGVHIYEYLPRLLHAKTVVVDGEWSMLGTANLDYRSLFINYELNLITRDPGVSRQLEQQFINDLRESEHILPTGWDRRGWSPRIHEFIGWFARRWL